MSYYKEARASINNFFPNQILFLHHLVKKFGISSNSCFAFKFALLQQSHQSETHEAFSILLQYSLYCID